MSAAQVRSRTEHAIASDDDVVRVRRHVRDLAHACGLDSFATAAITTATSELARNVLVHARRGVAVLEEITSNARRGLRLAFRDEGPGIADLTRALAGGNSTVRSLGLGLYGSKRLVDDFQIESAPGKGTTVTVIKWARY